MHNRKGFRGAPKGKGAKDNKKTFKRLLSYILRKNKLKMSWSV